MISKLMSCKFCHCTDARPCLIPMSFGTHPLSYGRDAALVADNENYPLMRPLLVTMRKKYPAYEPSDQVKQEIRERES